VKNLKKTFSLIFLLLKTLLTYKLLNNEKIKEPVMDSLLLVILQKKPNFHLLDIEDNQFFKTLPFLTIR